MADLQRFAPFRNLDQGSQTLLAQGLVCRQCSASDLALRKGQAVSGAYVVLSGRLRVYALSANGTEATLYFLDPGETCVLALNCLFNDLLYPAWVQAETASRVALIPGAVYRRLFEREPSIRNLTVQTLSTLVFRLMSELELVHSSHHKQRLANFILMQATSEGVLHMTQQQMAQHLGTTREVVARLMQELVGKGLVQSRRGAVAIQDLFGLRQVAITPSD